MKLAKDLETRDVESYLEKYEEEWSIHDKEKFHEMHDILSKNKCLNLCQLYQIALWKTKRSSKIVKHNPDEVVKGITELALKLTDERFKVRCLCVLKGIGVPRASAILAMYDPKRYGVIDVNAWYALTGKKKVSFNDEDWIYYLEQIRRLARKHAKTPREIDMALMKYGQKLMKKGEVIR
jgi:hypothetical protein